MWFSKKAGAKVAAAPPPVPAASPAPEKKQATTKNLGDAAEALALAYLKKAGLKWVESNYRTPGRGGGEIDLVMRAADDTLVFVEVRHRSTLSHGGAGASISGVKQQRIVYAARRYLMRFGSSPPCRFDVVLVEGRPDSPGGYQVEWLPAAFDASQTGC